MQKKNLSSLEASAKGKGERVILSVFHKRIAGRRMINRQDRETRRSSQNRTKAAGLKEIAARET